jgi:hypothetical protein
MRIFLRSKIEYGSLAPCRPSEFRLPAARFVPLHLRLSALRRHARAFSIGVLPAYRVKQPGVLGRSLMKLEEIAIGNNLTGVEPTLVVSVIAARPIADGALEVIYKTPDGTIRDRLLGRADEESINIATVERPWSLMATAKPSSSRSRRSEST